MMIFLCVSPDKLWEVWAPHARTLIERAVERCGDWTIGDVERLLLDRGLLWIAAEGPVIKGAWVVELLGNTKNGMFCHIVACGGTLDMDWQPMLAKIEEWARSEGCSRMRLEGRPGWARVLEPAGYREPFVALEKVL